MQTIVTDDVQPINKQQMLDALTSDGVEMALCFAFWNGKQIGLNAEQIEQVRVAYGALLAAHLSVASAPPRLAPRKLVED